MRVVVLYTRLTTYWTACMERAVELCEAEFLVYRYAPSDQAPFQISSLPGITIHAKEDFNAEQIQGAIEEFRPDLLYVAGWSDPVYKKLALKARGMGIRTIVGMDNHWLGTTRQYLASLLSKWMVRRYFDMIWIPGKPQYRFARMLGYKDEDILQDLYCADERGFTGLDRTAKKDKLLFVGRLVAHKGLKTLFAVLTELLDQGQLNFEVELIGNGPLAEEIPKHDLIQHCPFVDPSDLPAHFSSAGIFVLPSDYEAWGVVVHEAVMAGLPVISTFQTGAATAFVREGINGELFEAGDSKRLKEIILQYVEMEELPYMRQVASSLELAGTIDRESWVGTLQRAIGKE